MFDDDYEDYQVYPIATTFADTNKDAIISYLQKLPITVEVTNINIMEVTINGNKLNFYRVGAKNIMVNTTWSVDYIIIDCDLV